MRFSSVRIYSQIARNGPREMLKRCLRQFQLAIEDGDSDEREREKETNKRDGEAEILQDMKLVKSLFNILLLRVYQPISVKLAGIALFFRVICCLFRLFLLLSLYHSHQRRKFHKILFSTS